MYNRISIDLSDLVLCISDALDLVSRELSQHQIRTAFIAWELAKAADMPNDQQQRLFIAALLHDIGALSPEEKVSIHRNEVADPETHCRYGEILLKRVPIFADAATLVRHHHRPWEQWEQGVDDPVVFGSQLLYLADLFERMVSRNTFILHQDREIIEAVRALSGSALHPQVVELFLTITGREDFWFDLVSPRLYTILFQDCPCKGTRIDMRHLKPISELCRNIIDFRSRFTSTHSTGVATAAAVISRHFGLTGLETELMEVAGNFHDIGKMAIPNSILEKPGSLTREEFSIVRQHTYFTYTVLNSISGFQFIAEWAAFHHERLSGSGYPFHLAGDSLSTGSRILAVADIFTALAEDRPYRRGMNRQGIIGVLDGLRGRDALDGRVIDILCRNYDEIHELTVGQQTRARQFYETEFVTPL